MGWFGSLELAYKYAIVLGSLFLLVIIAGVIKVYFSKRKLKKYTRKAEEDAAGAGEERVELNKRELDEGDLFGIRAIQSGYFGGVAQSRPSSIAEDRSDRDSMASNTLLGSHHSPERKGPSPMSSVVTLPLEARTSPSPLRHTVASATDPDRSRMSKRQGPPPIRSTLQPSDAQISGVVSHDPAVDMSLNVPPSPGATSRPSYTGLDSDSRSSSDDSAGPEDTLERSPDSSSFPQYSQYSGHYIPTAAPQLPVTVESKDSARPASSAQYPEYEPQSQSASIVSGDSDATIRGNHRSFRSSIQDETDFSTRPVKSRTNSMGKTRSSIQEDENLTVKSDSRPISTNRPHSTSTSPYDYQPPEPSGTSPRRNNEAPAVPHLQNQQPLSDGQWSSATLGNKAGLSTNPQHINRNHTSHPSATSSMYSSAQRNSILPGSSTNTRTHSRPRSPNSPSRYPAPPPAASSSQGTRRPSDASSHRPPPSSNPSSVNTSHRNTRELGDLYDSYWRQNGQSVNISNGPPSTEEKRNREPNRRDRLETEVPTITETGTRVASPAPRGGVGMAM